MVVNGKQYCNSDFKVSHVLLSPTGCEGNTMNDVNVRQHCGTLIYLHPPSSPLGPKQWLQQLRGTDHYCPSSPSTNAHALLGLLYKT